MPIQEAGKIENPKIPADVTRGRYISSVKLRYCTPFAFPCYFYSDTYIGSAAIRMSIM